MSDQPVIWNLDRALEHISGALKTAKERQVPASLRVRIKELEVQARECLEEVARYEAERTDP